MSKTNQPVETRCLNGRLRQGDIVFSAQDADYAYLVGRVIKINLVGSDEHNDETKNETDDVHVDFLDAAYSRKRIKEIERAFSDAYVTKKRFDDCPLDDAIMAPADLICINTVGAALLRKICESAANAELFCEGAMAALEHIYPKLRYRRELGGIN